MREDIRAWLNGARGYAAGVQLYARHGQDAALLQRLQGEETPTTKKLLFTALKSLIAAPPPAAETKGLETAPKSPEASLQLNDAAKEAKRDADRLFKELSNKRAELLAICPLEEGPLDAHPGEKKNRGALAKEIMRLELLVEEAYADYQWTVTHGVRKVKPAPATEEIDPLHLPIAINNLRKYLSKLRKEPVKNATKIIEKEYLLEKYLAQYEQAKSES